jgi:glycerol-3-phosphate dehydrogenase (NAD(P)+)
MAARAGRPVQLWALEPEVVEAVNHRHENTAFLPGVPLEPSITATADMAALAAVEAVFVVTPAQHVRATLRKFAPLARDGLPVVLCAKGVERGSLSLMSEVVAAEAPHACIGVLSGPSFARDVVRGLPTAVTLACADLAVAERLADMISQPTFRPYLSDDVVGAEVGGAVKNVIAIACGVAEGRRLGDSARAALITRGFAEMSRLGLALGGRQETLNGLCGLGDLVLTCSSRTSRNMSFGVALGEGRSPDEAQASSAGVAEGAASAPAVVALAARHGVEMPICEAVLAVLEGRFTVDEAIDALLSRPLRIEGA